MLSILTTNKKEHRECLEVIYMMVLQVCAYVQTHLIIYIIDVQLFGISIIPQKAIKNKLHQSR